jgi:hypothetical protein
MKKQFFSLKAAMLCIMFLLAAHIHGKAQGVEREGKTSANASQIYLEAGGSAILYSINYDGRFGKFENGFGFRIGIGGAGYRSDGYVAIPAQVNYLIGSKGQYLELGAGVTYVSVSNLFFDSDNNDEANTVAGSAVLGFRKQPFGKKGLTWRIAFTPFIGFGGLQPFFGASIGYRL